LRPLCTLRLRQLHGAVLRLARHKQLLALQLLRALNALALVPPLRCVRRRLQRHRFLARQQRLARARRLYTAPTPR